MDKKGLVIGIDFTEEFSMVCYFNERHGRVENAVDPLSSSCLLIPSAVSYDSERGSWLTGEAAREYSRKTGAFLYTELLTNTIAEGQCENTGERLSYSSIFAVFIDALIEMAYKCAGLRPAAFVNITLRRINIQIKDAMERVLARVKSKRDCFHLLSYQESFAYFTVMQEETLWADGADLFDFSNEGFFINRLTCAAAAKEKMIFVNEQNFSMDFSCKDLKSAYSRMQLDEKLCTLYGEIKNEAKRSSVYFTGEGFEEPWYSNTLSTISHEKRVFRGNNIYARGACLEGVLRKRGTLSGFKVICRAKTRACVSVQARRFSLPEQVILSDAALNWYEAGSETDFILDDERKISFTVTSPFSRQKTEIDFDLSSFPERPPLASRVRVKVNYINEYECEISVRDLGLGQFYEPCGVEVKKILNLEGYI